MASRKTPYACSVTSPKKYAEQTFARRCKGNIDRGQSIVSGLCTIQYGSKLRGCCNNIMARSNNIDANNSDCLIDAAHNIVNNDEINSSIQLSKGELCNAARIIYNSRRLRSNFLFKSMFGEPAWDILLVLYFQDSDGSGLTTKIACMAADVPQTTAWRWLQILKGQKLIEQVGSLEDGRLSRFRLSKAGRSAMEGCLAAYAALL